jgi:hypothetical protein
MRQRLQYSESEIQRAQFTRGKEWMLEDGTEYIGLYHTYITGEIYTEAVWNSNTSVKLIPYEDINSDTYQYKQLTDIKTKYNIVQPIRRKVTLSERRAGVMTRYFIRAINSSNIIEIDENQYTQYIGGDIDPNYYVAVSLQWTIAGEVNDRVQDGVLKTGITTKNTQAIQQAEQTIPGLSSYLTDLLEHVTDNQYQIPRDINS